ncbi:MAG: hypothetical protein LUD72_01065 [Bacteroidales bacterium]|nr:hypothetical protein [Bacteroidales bacterium]
MASNRKHTNDPAELTLRVWVIEQRCKGSDNWRMLDVMREDFPEYQLVCECERRSQERTDYEFRYRAATLTFDDDGGKCVIY